MRGLLKHRIIAASLLGLFAYALIYVGFHQLDNPAQLSEECALVDHHLHQNPDKHSCDLCDYYQSLENVTYDFQDQLDFATPKVSQAAYITTCLARFNLSLLRAPPIS